MAVDYLSQVLGAGQQPASGDSAAWKLWNNINTWLASLGNTQRQQALRFIPGGFGDAGLTKLAANLKQQFGGDPTTATKPAPPPPDPLQTTTVRGAGGTAVTTPVLGQPYQPNFATYSPVSAQQYTGATDLASLAALAGVDASTFQKQWNDYQRQRQVAASHTLAGDEPIHGLSLQQFAALQGSALQGQWQPVLDAFDYQWDEQYGTRMPGELRQQLLTALSGLDHNQQQAVLEAEQQYVSSLTTARQSRTGIGPAIGALVQQILGQVPASVGNVSTQYAQKFPSVSAEVAKDIQARKQGYIQWLQEHNVPITDDLLNKLVAMPAGSPTNPEPGSDYAYLLAQPSNIKGLTWGQKDISFGNLSTLWKEYFSREPNNQELMWSVGKTPDEIQSFIDNSPSSIPGVTVKKYRDYTDFINRIGTSGVGTGGGHGLSSTIDDSLVADLHKQITSQSTGRAHPGNM